MSSDGLSFAFSTGGGLAAWVTTFSLIVPIFWGMYVLILIAIKPPDLYENNPVFRSGCNCLGSHFHLRHHGRGKDCCWRGIDGYCFSCRVGRRSLIAYVDPLGISTVCNGRFTGH